ncbi:hypothetical protein GCM10023193_58910 [Planotetraspora kaengkrachanensis]|uniref:Uncharacterized protein n=1 Tax=Planotetraspora kaengkrachanensis TaxID=575193 RepID=A0A8J3V8R5_9ACTN|nr:hypothetical protein Pka01_52200 [Planotetraspora kaengkrachanensis]
MPDTPRLRPSPHGVDGASGQSLPGKEQVRGEVKERVPTPRQPEGKEAPSNGLASMRLPCIPVRQSPPSPQAVITHRFGESPSDLPPTPRVIMHRFEDMGPDLRKSHP